MIISKNKLLQLRLSKNFTYRQLADDINNFYDEIVVSASSLNRWETFDNCKVNVMKLSKMANYFGISLNELVMEECIDTDFTCDLSKSSLDSKKMSIVGYIYKATEEEINSILEYLKSFG